MKKLKCETCEKEIDMNNIKSKTYRCVKPVLIGDSCVCDAIDCPNCGCQIILKVRFPKKVELVTGNVNKK